jgi:hypothetical protein
MRDPNNDRRARQRALWYLLAILLGVCVAIYYGWRLLEPDMVWATGGSDGRWLGLFVCILLVGMGSLALWNGLFARPLTSEEERLRDQMREWERERARFMNGSGQ